VWLVDSDIDDVLHIFCCGCQNLSYIFFVTVNVFLVFCELKNWFV
jgi:hypothetical protein